MNKLFIIVSLITNAVSIICLSNKLDATTDKKICTRPQCQLAASFLQNSLNLSVNPCEDFYSYACGGWTRNNNIPEHKQEWSPELKQAQLNYKSLLETDFDALKHRPCVKQALNFQSACNEWRNKNSHTLLRHILEDINWPLIDLNWSRKGDTYNWDEAYAKIYKKMGSFELPLMDLETKSFFQNYEPKLRISPQDPLIRLDTSEKLDSKSNSLKKNEHKKYIKEVLKLLSKTNEYNSSDIDTQIELLVNFDIKLNKLKSEGERDYLFNITIKAFMNRFTEIPLLRILQKITLEAFNDSNIITENNTIDVINVHYFEQLSQIMSSTDNRTIANYIGWRLAYHLISDTTEEKTSRENCFQQTAVKFRFVIGRLFVDRYFTTEINNDVLKMGELLRQTFNSTINNNAWMSEHSKQMFLEKLHTIEYMMAYPNFVLNDTWLDNYYSQLGYINNWNFFDAIIKYREWTNQISLNRLRKRESIDLDFTSELELAWITRKYAHYVKNSNRIVIPVGFLQSPVYTFGLPAAMNFGSIGSVISRELNHAFDDENSKVNGDEHKINWRDKAVIQLLNRPIDRQNIEWNKVAHKIDWRDNQTKQIYDDKQMCFIKQYDSYYDSHTNLTINGTRTLNKNFADNEGVRLAFKAFKKSKSVEESLPGNIEMFSSDQLFFLSYASIYCSNFNRDALINYMESDVRSLPMYRVIGSLSNLVEFSDAFKCKSGDHMNNKNKCVLW